MLGFLWDRKSGIAQELLIEDLQLGNRGPVIMYAVGGEKEMTEQQIKNQLESNCGGRYQHSEATKNGKRYDLYYGNDGCQPSCVMRRAHVSRLHDVSVVFDGRRRPFSRF